MLYGRRLSNHAKTVGMYVLSYRNPKTYLCCPSMDRIARDMGISRRHVQDSVNELLAAGVLTKRLVRGHNEYTFVACPPPGMYADIEDATTQELRDMTEDMRKRAQARARINDFKFAEDCFLTFEAVKDEYYDAELRGGWPPEFVYEPVADTPIEYPF